MKDNKIFKKMDIEINGAIRPVLVTGEETLVDVIRKQFKLTGTKVGCRMNQCGICSVIVDGKVVRACVIKMSKIKDGAKITTIEGIGTPDNIHPLQQAWMKFGAAQCGICTPGFIVSAKALLDENVNPTREEIRDWFQKNRNACRCTGYKPIIDSVIAAAKVMRGEMNIEELAFKMPEDGRIYGTDYPRPTALSKVTGTLDYGSDTGLKLPDGTLRLALVQSKVAHGNILSIDTSEAEKMPGIEAVLTYKDVKGSNRIRGIVSHPLAKCDGADRPILCEEKVLQYGDVIAIICADTQKNANAAIEKVKVEIEPLPAYMSANEAIDADAIEIHPGSPNLYIEQPLIKGANTEDILEKAAVVLEREYQSSRQPHLVLEPDVGYAYYDEEGRLTIQSKSVAVYIHRHMLFEALGIDMGKLRIIQNNMGGSFGYKMNITNEGLLGVACMATGKPVFLEFDMHQQITYTGKRSPFHYQLKVGADEEGKIIALEETHLGDHGAYADLSDILLVKTNMFLGAGYHLPNIRGMGKMTFTNHIYGAPMRAFGSPQSFLAFESIMDELAKEFCMDPFEFRYKNLYNEESTTPTGCKPDVLVLSKLFDMIRPKYYDVKKTAKEESTDDKKRGVGVSLGIFGVGLKSVDVAEVAAELLPDNKIAVYSTWEDHGQGSDMGALATAHEALRELKVMPEDIVIILNDTQKCPNGGPASSSRSHLMLGNSIYDACQQLISAMKKENGTFRDYNEMICEGIATRHLGSFSTAPYCSHMDYETAQFNPFISYMYGVFVSDVEIDMKTGKVRVIKMVSAFDIGKIGNKTVVDGQVYGGLSQGIGFALSEDFEDVSKHTSLMKCGFPYIVDVPDDLEVMYLETNRPYTSFGSTGVGEVVTTSPHVSIINAIDDACGVRIRELPATPEKIIAELNKNKKK